MEGWLLTGYAEGSKVTPERRELFIFTNEGDSPVGDCWSSELASAVEVKIKDYKIALEAGTSQEPELTIEIKVKPCDLH